MKIPLFGFTLPTMKIREKIFLAVGTYIFLSAIMGAIAYRELYIIFTKLPVITKIDDLTHNIVEARRYEKTYLLYRNESDLLEFKKQIYLLKTDGDLIRPHIDKADLSAFDDAQTSLTEYDRLFDIVASHLRLQSEAERQLSRTGRALELKLRGSDLQNFLVLRGFERNHIIKKDNQSFSAFSQALHDLSARNSELIGYTAIAQKLFASYRTEQNTETRMREQARKYQAFFNQIFVRERAEIPETMKNSLELFMVSLLTVIILGAVVNTRLAMSIVRPLRMLEKKTKKIATGDFSEKIEVKGSDEIASLAQSFNRMEDHLKLAVSSFEHTITQLRENQAKLVEAEKLASIGILTAGIAHEINNPLTSVLSFSELMLEQMPENDINHRRLKIMIRDAQRARTIVRELLSFAKEDPIHRTIMDVNRSITEITESIAAQDAFKGIELKLDLAQNIPEIMADPVRIGQVVMNILLNAAHSITPPGTIELATQASESHIEIAISDTGSGIPKEHLNKIFDPFFTTKGTRKGTGLGLAISYGIIKKHNGSIEVKSILGKSSTFIVRLPIRG
ncbi:MAG TPA: ATP-binding protein [Dissulfurispiraceae bacterium]|nr:ATP-binding protein [Dissulfurispiraceae bacterium]